MKRYLFIILAALTVCTTAWASIIKQADKDRAAALVSQMTLDEKIEMISGKVDGFNTYAVPRLGIPSVRMADGPQGVTNVNLKNVRSTFYPCGLSVAATWNLISFTRLLQISSSFTERTETGKSIGCGTSATRQLMRN